MSTKREIAIKDSCILFDLLDLNLMEDFYQLGFEVYTTIQVIGEITDEDQLIEVVKYVDTGRLIIENDNPLETIQLISEENPGLSLADSSVLELAIRKNCTILSSDGSLRKVSERKNLNVRGMLWIIQELLDAKIITVDVAIIKLTVYPIFNQRAPRREVEAMLQELGNRNESSDN